MNSRPHAVCSNQLPKLLTAREFFNLGSELPLEGFL